MLDTIEIEMKTSLNAKQKMNKKCNQENKWKSKKHKTMVNTKHNLPES